MRLVNIGGAVRLSGSAGRAAVGLCQGTPAKQKRTDLEGRQKQGHGGKEIQFETVVSDGLGHS